MSTKFEQTAEQLLQILEGEEFYSVMLQDTVKIQNGKVMCKTSKLIIPDPNKELLGSLVDEMFINTFNCYPTDENIKRIFGEVTGKNFEEFFFPDA